MTSVTIDVTLKSYGYLPFKVKKESANWYKLEDGTILKLIPILMGVLANDKNNDGFLTNFINNVTAFVPKKNRISPSTQIHATQEVVNNMDKIDLPFTIISEGYNEYVIDNKILLSVKTALTQINKSKLRNNAGEPIYQINTAPLIKIKPKK